MKYGVTRVSTDCIHKVKTINIDQTLPNTCAFDALMYEMDSPLTLNAFEKLVNNKAPFSNQDIL